METSPATRSTPRVRRDEAGGKRPDGHKVPGLRHRPDPLGIRTAPTGDLLTGAAGLVAFGVFLQTLGVDGALHAAFDHLKSGPRMTYLMGDVLRMLVDLLVVGELRVYGMEAWAADPLFVRLAGGKKLCAMMVEHGLALLSGRSFPLLHIDIDTTVEALFGEFIEGARAGYNPRYHGRPSYHPMLARIAEVKAMVGARLRPGDTTFGKEDIPWLLEVIAAVRGAVGADTILVVRIDTAGDCVDVLDALDMQNVIFVIKAKMTPGLCEAIARLPDDQWKTIERDVDGRASKQVAIVEGFLRPCWEEHHVAYDVIAVRECDKIGGRKLYLWGDTDWTAHAFVTNAPDWDEEDIAEDYDLRAGIEPLIGELKGGYGLGKVPTNDFDANEVMFLLKLLAYNLMQRYVRKQHPTLATWQIGWLRRVLFLVPGRLIRHARGVTLQVPARSRLAQMLD